MRFNDICAKSEFFITEYEPPINKTANLAIFALDFKRNQEFSAKLHVPWSDSWERSSVSVPNKASPSHKLS